MWANWRLMPCSKPILNHGAGEVTEVPRSTAERDHETKPGLDAIEPLRWYGGSYAQRFDHCAQTSRHVLPVGIVEIQPVFGSTPLVQTAHQPPIQDFALCPLLPNVGKRGSR